MHTSIEPAGRGYPRPQMRRDGWQSLNGEWEFALDPDGRWAQPRDVAWAARIVVPFAPETPRSLVHNTGFFRVCWYRRTLPVHDLRDSERLILHFGAVDYSATVWCNDRLVGSHEGGYTPFCFDLTPFLADVANAAIVVRAEDDPFDLAKPRGKQDWQLEPHSIWYPRTSGIWQTVWTEIVPTTHIDRIRWTPNLERWEIGFEAWVSEPAAARLRMHVHLQVDDTVIADDTFAVIAGE